MQWFRALLRWFCDLFDVSEQVMRGGSHNTQIQGDVNHHHYHNEIVSKMKKNESEVKRIREYGITIGKLKALEGVASKKAYAFLEAEFETSIIIALNENQVKLALAYVIYCENI